MELYSLPQIITEVIIYNTTHIMGICISKPLHKINIPFDHSLLEIATFNLKMKKSLGVPNKITKIIKYIFSPECPDVICLQGLNDRYTLHVFSQIFYKQPDNDKLTIVPDIKEFNTSDIASLSIAGSIGTSTSSSKRELAKFTNIIITRHDAIDYFTEKIGVDDEVNYLPDVYLVCCNLKIKNQIISIYTSSLTKNAPFFQTNLIREKQLNKLEQWFKENRLNKNNSIHILSGSFAIPEINDTQTNPEYLSIVNKFNMIDLFRVINNQDRGYTNNEETRTDYHMIMCNISEYQQILQDVRGDANDKHRLIAQIYKIYGLYPVDIKINTELKISPHYMVVINLMIKNTSDNNTKSS